MDVRDERELEVPLGQRLFDNWVLLLVAGLAVVAVLYIGWGLYEIVSLPQATLP
jgi:cytochrome c-type biogenesis protein CcmH/NrfG